MKLLLINQYGPPDTSPTARLAGDLAEHLTTAGHTVHMVSSSSEITGYREKYRGLGRLLIEGSALLSLVWKSLWVGSADQVIVFSSPPMALLAGVCAGRYHHAPVVHWVLDAYPDVAGALGAGGPDFIQKRLRNIMRQAYDYCRQVVAVSDAMRDMLAERYQVNAAVIYPWPPDLPVKSEVLPWPNVPADYRVWCYSGNLGKAHEWSVLLDVQQELELRQVPLALVVQGGGDSRAKLRQEASNRGIRHVYLQNYALEQELIARLHAAAVRVVTLKVEMSGLLWPSKWAVIDCLPGPHLWIGPGKDLGHGTNEQVGRFDIEHYGSIADWLEEKSQGRPVLDVMAFKESVDHKRCAGLTKWQQLLEQPSADPF
ncbi:MAG: glycosyltransferase [Verrucomicrobiota bacterium]